MSQLVDDSPLQCRQILALLNEVVLEGLKEEVLQLVKAHQDQHQLLPVPCEEQYSSPEILMSVQFAKINIQKRVKTKIE